MTGEAPNLLTAWDPLAATGRDPIIDVDAGHKERVRYATQRLREMPDDAPDPVSGQAPRRQEEYDLDRHEDRVTTPTTEWSSHMATVTTLETTTIPAMTNAGDRGNYAGVCWTCRQQVASGMSVATAQTWCANFFAQRLNKLGKTSEWAALTGL